MSKFNEAMERREYNDEMVHFLKRQKGDALKLTSVKVRHSDYSNLYLDFNAWAFRLKEGTADHYSGEICKKALEIFTSVSEKYRNQIIEDAIKYIEADTRIAMKRASLELKAVLAEIEGEGKEGG